MQKQIRREKEKSLLIGSDFVYMLRVSNSQLLAFPIISTAVLAHDPTEVRNLPSLDHRCFFEPTVSAGNHTDHT